MNDLAQRDAAEPDLDPRGPLPAGRPLLVVALVTLVPTLAGVVPLPAGLAIAGLLAFAGMLRSSLALDRRQRFVAAPVVDRARTRAR